MVMPLKPRQRRILEAVARFVQSHGYGPSTNELRADAEISSGSLVWSNLSRLRTLRLLDYDEGRARSVRLTSEGWDAAGFAQAGCTCGLDIVVGELERVIDRKNARIRYLEGQMLRLQGDGGGRVRQGAA